MGRRLSLKEMNIIRHDADVYNSKVKRGVIVERKGGRHVISMCGCGSPGCAIHTKAMHNPYPDSKYAYF